MTTGLPVAGPDGLPRCPWSLSAPEYLSYHDEEWGWPVRDDLGIFERLCLEAFQSGLSWLTILRKRENFRAAFSGFDIEAVASFGPADVARLLADARAALALPVGLADLVWQYAADQGQAPVSLSDVPPVTSQSKALAKDLRSRGFTFTGPVTAYATMQSCGVVNDHLAGCVSRGAAEAARRA